MKRRGTVLLVVMVIVMLLSLAAYNYMLSMQTEHIATAVVGERLAARQAAYSARDLLAVLLEKSRAERDAMGGLRDNLQLFGGQSAAISQTGQLATKEASTTMGLIAYPIHGSHAAGSAGTASESVPHVGENSEPRSAQHAPAEQVGSSRGKPTRYGAVNESSKLHLDKLLELELTEPGSAVEKLMRLPGMDQATAEALLDWIDADDEQRPNGAEADFYSTLIRPLVPRNGLPSDLDELLFVKGVTPQRLFDDPAVLADPTMPGLSPPREIGGEQSVPWLDLITVYSAERNETYAGRPRIFVNAQDLSQLHRDLAEVMPVDWATFIVLFRQFGPSTAATAKNDENKQATIDFAIPAEFEIESPFDLIGISVTLTDGSAADSEEVTVESPFPDDLTSMQSQLPQLFDAITLVPENRVIGRINVNEAPGIVLSTLPGLDEETIESIVAARQTESIDNTSRSHPVWLLVEGVVSREVMREILPHVTCGGDVYRASVWGRLDDTSPLFHFETVLDASEGIARSVYYRELAAPRNAIQIATPEAFGRSEPNVLR